MKLFFLKTGAFAMSLSQLGWGLWLSVVLTLLACWGQERTCTCEMLFLAHQAYMPVPEPREVGPPLIPALANVRLIAAGCSPDC